MDNSIKRNAVPGLMSVASYILGTMSLGTGQHLLGGVALLLLWGLGMAYLVRDTRGERTRQRADDARRQSEEVQRKADAEEQLRWFEERFRDVQRQVVELASARDHQDQERRGKVVSDSMAAMLKRVAEIRAERKSQAKALRREVVEPEKSQGFGLGPRAGKPPTQPPPSGQS